LAVRRARRLRRQLHVGRRRRRALLAAPARGLRAVLRARCRGLVPGASVALGPRSPVLPLRAPGPAPRPRLPASRDAAERSREECPVVGPPAPARALVLVRPLAPTAVGPVDRASGGSDRGERPLPHAL